MNPILEYNFKRVMIHESGWKQIPYYSTNETFNNYEFHEFFNSLKGGELIAAGSGNVPIVKLHLVDIDGVVHFDVETMEGRRFSDLFSNWFEKTSTIFNVDNFRNWCEDGYYKPVEDVNHVS